MKNTVIIYGSQYGTTKRYAEYLSEMTGIEAVAFKKAKTILATYGKKEDFVDFKSLEKLGSVIK